MNSVTTVPGRTTSLACKDIRTACPTLGRECRQTEGASGVYRVDPRTERSGAMDGVEQIWKRKDNATVPRTRSSWATLTTAGSRTSTATGATTGTSTSPSASWLFMFVSSSLRAFFRFPAVRPDERYIFSRRECEGRIRDGGRF